MSLLSATTGTEFGPDAATMEAFRSLVSRNPWLVDVGEVVAVVLHPWSFRVVVLAGCAWAWMQGRTRAATVCAATMVTGSLLGVGLKLAIRRDRPPGADPIAAEIGFSMPSGHALNAALGCGLLLVLALPWLRRRGRHRAALVGACALVLVVCLDRLVLNVHYLSDVTVGVLLGGGLALLADRLSPRLRGGLAAGLPGGRIKCG